VNSALAALAEKHGSEPLIRSGLADSDSGPVVRHGPMFADPGSLFVSLRYGGGGPPFDLLTNRGCVSGRLANW